ncbi:MAG: arginase family protein [Actinomycetota bacterium]
MTVILSPFHLDERLDGPWPLEADATIDPALPEASAWDRMAVIAVDVADAVATALRAGDVPIVLSGDCVAALAVVSGVQAAGVEPTLIWLDAHGDVQSPETSGSGYLGGMPIRQLVGGADRTVPDALTLQPIDEADVVLLDGRDLDPPEAAFLTASRIRHLPLQPVVVPCPVVLHVDLDVIDDRDAPGLLFPVGDGPSLDMVAAVLRQLLERNDVVAISLACTTSERTGPAAQRIAELLVSPA